MQITNEGDVFSIFNVFVSILSARYVHLFTPVSIKQAPECPYGTFQIRQRPFAVMQLSIHQAYPRTSRMFNSLIRQSHKIYLSKLYRLKGYVI